METVQQTETMPVSEALAALSALVGQHGLPEPEQVTFRSEYVQLHVASTAEVDAWCAVLGLTPDVHVFESVDGPTFGYSARGWWLGQRAGVCVHHPIPTGDELVEQPAVTS